MDCLRRGTELVPGSAGDHETRRRTEPEPRSDKMDSVTRKTITTGNIVCSKWNYRFTWYRNRDRDQLKRDDDSLNEEGLSLMMVAL